MEPISIVAVITNLISAAVAFLAGFYTYRYMQHSEEIFVVKEKTPFFTVGLVAFGVAALFDAVSIFAGVETSFTVGTIIRMIALIYIAGGAIGLLRLLEKQEPFDMPPGEKAYSIKETIASRKLNE